MAPPSAPSSPSSESQPGLEWLQSQQSSQPRGALMFAQPEPETSPPYPQDGSPSPSDGTSDELPDPSTASPRSSAGSSGNAGSAKVLRDAVRAGVGMAGGVAHQLLARDEAAIDAQLYLADPDDVVAIGDPLAAIAQRRGGIGVAGNPDLADAIACLVGLALYASKQIARWMQAKELRRNLATGGTPDARTEDAAGDRPQSGFEAASGPLARFHTSDEAADALRRSVREQ